MKKFLAYLLLVIVVGYMLLGFVLLIHTPERWPLAVFTLILPGLTGIICLLVLRSIRQDTRDQKIRRYLEGLD
jgi:uncharacterized protein (DUF983 family)